MGMEDACWLLAIISIGLMVLVMILGDEQG
jgi:hypothetical protein